MLSNTPVFQPPVVQVPKLEDSGSLLLARLWQPMEGGKSFDHCAISVMPAQNPVTVQGLVRVNRRQRRSIAALLPDSQD